MPFLKFICVQIEIPGFLTSGTGMQNVNYPGLRCDLPSCVETRGCVWFCSGSVSRHAAAGRQGADTALLLCRTLYQKYKAEGFNLIAFPCNQFGGQAPGTSQEQREAAFAKFGFEFDVMDHIEARTLPAALSRRCRPLSGHNSQCIRDILVVHS